MTVFTTQKSSIASEPPSLPKPDSLIPPNGLQVREGRGESSHNSLGDDTGIDPDHTSLQRTGHASYSICVSSEEVGGKTDVGIVCELKHFFLCFEWDHCCHRAKRFLLADELV